MAVTKSMNHLALEVESENQLNDIYQRLKQSSEVSIEFSPQLVGSGPGRHMMCYEPGGIRVEFIWSGPDYGASPGIIFHNVIS